MEMVINHLGQGKLNFTLPFVYSKITKEVENMKYLELIAPCHFGLESVLKREILELGYDISKVEDGRVTFFGNAEAICRANIFLRTAERILLKVGEFKAVTFDELF